MEKLTISEVAVKALESTAPDVTMDEPAAAPVDTITQEEKEEEEQGAQGQEAVTVKGAGGPYAGAKNHQRASEPATSRDHVPRSGGRLGDGRGRCVHVGSSRLARSFQIRLLSTTRASISVRANITRASTGEATRG